MQRLSALRRVLGAFQAPVLCNHVTINPSRVGSLGQRKTAQTQPQWLQPQYRSFHTAPVCLGRPRHDDEEEDMGYGHKKGKKPMDKVKKEKRKDFDGFKKGKGRDYEEGRGRRGDDDWLDGGERRERPKKKQVEPKVVNVAAANTLAHLSEQMGFTIEQIQRNLYDVTGDRYDGDSLVSEEIAELLVADSNMTAKRLERFVDVAFRPPPEDMSILPRRPPIVTIMGHVDHGKTSLLDYFRKSRIVDGEAGGITQHIGAFSVRTSSDDPITFIDTPGHAAFSAMRKRGAQVTDVVILVVAANEGVKAQTLEAIKHARDRNVPMIVALNKVDLPDADPERVKRDLLSAEVHVEDLGGDVQCVEISAKTGKNVAALEEAIILQAEMMDLRGDPNGPAEGYVIEAKKDKGLGAVATTIITRGTLRVGSILVSGNTWAKVRVLYNDLHQPIKEVGPAEPCDMIGWRDVPMSGSEIVEVNSEHRAHEVVRNRAIAEKMGNVADGRLAPKRDGRKQDAMSLSQKNRLKKEKAQSGEPREEVDEWPKVLPILVKGDVVGTVEAMVSSLATLNNQYVHNHVIHTGVGPVTESDLDLAETANGAIVAFNAQTSKAISQRAEHVGVRIIQSKIIYHVLEEVEEELGRLMPEVEKEQVLGKANVLQVFALSGKNQRVVAGCRVVEGALKRSAKYRVLRNGEEVFNGTGVEIRHKKSVVDGAQKDTECGILLEKYHEFAVGDVIQCYTTTTQRMKFEKNA